jgi:glycosyltransferase involved in cell wall biosynthesis
VPVVRRISAKLSVVVPAYRESVRIARSLQLLKRELQQIGADYEIVLVCDGCRDTYDAARPFIDYNVAVYYYERNMGKGYALQYGADRATGELVTFIDADMNIHPREILTFIKLIDALDADIVIGSKRHPQSRVSYPAFRRLQSFVYQLLIAALFTVNVKDTQSGLKLFRRDVLRSLLPRVLVKRYAFDLELLVVAHHLGYKRIVEAPIEIQEQFSTTTNLRAAFRVLVDTAAIFYRLRVIRYYDEDHHTVPAPAPADGVAAGAQSRQYM